MKAKDLKPNTVYQIQPGQYGSTPMGFEKFVLTGDEIVPVVDDRTYRDQTTKRFIEVFAVKWNYETNQYETVLSACNEAGTRSIALMGIAGWSGAHTLDEITADKLESQKHDLYVDEDRKAQREANKVRWAVIDTATFDLLNVNERDRPNYLDSRDYGAADEGQNGVKVNLTLAQIEEVNALVTLLKEAA